MNYIKSIKQSDVLEYVTKVSIRIQKVIIKYEIIITSHMLEREKVNLKIDTRALKNAQQCDKYK